MRFLRTFHGRLTATYASALFVGLCLFAAVSAFFLVRLYQSVVDTHLRTTATALTAVSVSAQPGLQLDAEDAAQFAASVSPRLDAALFRIDGSLATTSTAIVPAAVRAMAAAPPADLGPRTIDAKPDRLRVIAWPINQEGRRAGTLLVWSSTAPLEDFEWLLGLVFGIGIPVLVAVAISSAELVTQRGLEPLRGITRLATEIEAHDLSRRLRLPLTDDELGRLGATFDRMLDRLQAAFERQRRFTADASHELRTPLTVIRAEADLALSKERSPAEYRKALLAIAAEADRIEALIGGLLSLARAEAGPPQEETTVDFSALVADAATRLEPVAASRGIRLEAAVEPGARVSGDASALARVPLALLHNGVKYARAGGFVRVTLSNGGQQVVLAVRDDGPGFTDEGLRRATERFWRDDRGRGRDGTGLGLAIVRAIVEQSRGSIELHNAPDSGAEVVVRIPAINADV